MAKILRYVLLFLFILVLIVGAFLVYTEKSIPNFKSTEIIFSGTTDAVLSKDTISILTWNVGYCGLGSDMDFFYDGGTRMRTSKSQMLKNIEGVKDALSKNSDADFILLQEVDRESKRSYGINQELEFSEDLPAYSFFFASNYVVELVPMPLSNPLGKINSGILTMSSVTPKLAVRHSYPDKHPWPTGLFMPKRCFLETRIATPSGRDLVLVNTHNSAYDDGNLRKMEMEMLRNFALSEYKKGNWVIVGGDWNQNPPGYVQKNADKDALKNFTPRAISGSFFPVGWSWIWDKKVSSNRFLNRPYEEGVTMTTTIDLFLASPNVEGLSVDVISDGFRYSDHQPLRVKFVLK